MALSPRAVPRAAGRPGNPDLAAVAGCQVDLETLWGATASRNPGCYLAHINLGRLYFQQGRLDEAIAQDQKALDIRPDSAEIHNDLGLALMQRGRAGEAIAHYQKALAIRPVLTEARVNWGNALAQEGRLDGAVAQYPNKPWPWTRAMKRSTPI